MLKTITVVLPLLLATGSARASEIPQSLLDADYTQCLATCGQSRDETQCATYCSCVTEGVQSEFTLEEYTPMALAMAAGQQADSESVTRLGTIATTCIRDTFQ